jgi:hypothetical protein
MSAKWLEDLKPPSTDGQKAFFKTAPYLIVIFKRKDENGKKRNNYYVQ